MRAFGPRDRRDDRALVQLQRRGVDGRIVRRAPEAVLLGIGLDQGDAVLLAAGLAQIAQRFLVDVIAERLPATIELSLVALIFALGTAIPLGVLAAIRKNSLLDRLATVGSLLGVSMPGFWFGILLIVLIEMALITPPVGLNLFVAMGIAKMSLFEVFRAAIPTIFLMVLALLLISYIPIISMLLPSLLF